MFTLHKLAFRDSTRLYLTYHNLLWPPVPTEIYYPCADLFWALWQFCAFKSSVKWLACGALLTGAGYILAVPAPA